MESLMRIRQSLSQRIKPARVVIALMLAGCAPFPITSVGELNSLNGLNNSGNAEDKCACSTELRSGETPLAVGRDRCTDPRDPGKPKYVPSTRKPDLDCSPEGSKGGCFGNVRPGTIVTVRGPCGSTR